jgi:hypothetical protein
MFNSVARSKCCLYVLERFVCLKVLQCVVFVLRVSKFACVRLSLFECAGVCTAFVKSLRQVCVSVLD